MNLKIHEYINNYTVLFLKTYYKMQYTFNNIRGDAIIFNIVIFFIVILICCFLYTLSYSKQILNNWVENRCHPFIMPFAGWIQPNTSTSQNFNFCIQSILSTSIATALFPFQTLIALFSKEMNVVADGLNDVRQTASNMRTGVNDVTKNIMSRIITTTVPLQQSVLTTKDIFNKTQGILNTGLYSGLGVYYTLKSSIGTVINSMINILIAMIAMILPLLAFPPTAVYAMPMIAVFTSIAVPLGLTITSLTKSMGIRPNKSIPKLKKPRLCFSQFTIIPLKNGSTKYIKDIEPGDETLHDGSVLSTFILLGNTEPLYKIKNTIVSKSHFLFDVENKIWKTVAEFFDAIPIQGGYTHMFCLSTTNKTITTQDGLIFKDWNDDIQHNHISSMKSFYPKNTNIIINNNQHCHLDKIQIGMTLDSNNTCFGIIHSLHGIQLITSNKSFQICDNAHILHTIKDYDAEIENM